MKTQNNNNQTTQNTNSVIKQKFDVAIAKMKTFFVNNVAIMLLLAVIAVNALLITIVPGLMPTFFGSCLGFIDLAVILIGIILVKTK